MRKPVVLITGAGGEIGHGLIDRLSPSAPRHRHARRRAARRRRSRRWSIARSPARSSTAALLERILAEYQVELVFHLAALLSTRSEFTPVTAHQVNVEGTLNLLEFAQHEAESHGRPVVFIYPSSIAAYGLPDVATKARGRPRQGGRVDASDDDVRVQQAVLRAARPLLRAVLQAAGGGAAAGRVDFRCVRFPGLISALTVPSGGTSDYAPEMIHAAAKGEPYACFVRPDTRIPFMAMPDGVDALLHARRGAARRALTNRLQRRRVQPVGRGGPRRRRSTAFPGRRRSRGRSTSKRQGIVDSWPADVDDSAARRRLGLRPALRLSPRVQRVSDSDYQRDDTRRPLTCQTSNFATPTPKQSRSR